MRSSPASGRASIPIAALQLKGRRKDLLTERKKLPGQIAVLSAEGKRFLDTMADVDCVALVRVR